jgi:tetratricopeptide (TPR) repeat protein
LGLTHFCNERDWHSFHDSSVIVLRKLIEEYPTDAESRLWYGYVLGLAGMDAEQGMNELQTCLKLTPFQPYAALNLAGGFGPNKDTIALLKSVLNPQPNNYRALRDLGRAYLRLGEFSSARETFELILSAEPYWDKRGDFMNEYVNDVFTYAKQRDRAKRQALLLLNELRS